MFGRRGGGGGIDCNSPRLIVACREMTSGVSGVSSSSFRFAKSCTAHNAFCASLACGTQVWSRQDQHCHRLAMHAAMPCAFRADVRISGPGSWLPPPAPAL